ncbi:DUF87 domain-containing protein [Mycolicibacterium sp. CAU 1645]|uniref:DUF87 domain-containing protein n=1 Tax=Mycolicibacterium arenosum TaxID=2952157 RepID=A0ABT1M7H8_9MYCO|nr:DUF87 domain-containing protein [Mycolicibacterium sp. CAU 1645]MCP9275131.1 DUF87 domain-containing protein [Mycolicibacterium sp. CAU 1645]
MIDERQRKALAELRLNWVETLDDIWHPQESHIGGLHDGALADVMSAFDDADQQPDSSPIGVALRGRAGSGKTHLLGHVRDRVQSAGGYFFMVQLLDATNFWQSTRGGIMDSLGRPGKVRETQLKDLLWQLEQFAHVSRAARRALIGDEDLTPEILNEFVEAVGAARGATVRSCRQTLRAMVLVASNDPALQDIGEAFLGAGGEISADERVTWGLRAENRSAQQTVGEISRLVALAGPAVLAIDQIDTLLAQATSATGDGAVHDDSRNLEHVAHGLMGIKEATRRTVAVVACLPSVWELIQDKATATVADRFRESEVLERLPNADVGRAILERRFSARYRLSGFLPPYPSWPILPSAFDDAPDYTPRRLLQRADEHVRACLRTDEVVELAHLGDEIQTTTTTSTTVPQTVTAELDRRFAEYRGRAVASAALNPDGEDTTVPGLLAAGLQAWIAERDSAERSFRTDPPPGRVVALHARLRQSLDAATEDERHWSFRAIAHGHAGAVQTRIRKAWDATGIASDPDRRRLVLLRNTAWPGGAKTAALIAEVEAAGVRTLPLSESDLRTLSALRDMIDDDHRDLPDWLRQRQPAHGTALLRAALDDVAGEAPPAPQPPPETPVAAPTSTAPDYPDVVTTPDMLPLGVDTAGVPVSVQLSALRKHTVIFAGSGSGKTVLIRRLIEECALRGVSSIVLDPNNDLSRLGSPWPEPPIGWNPADDARAAEFFANSEVVVWTPRRDSGRPLSFQPLPDFAGVIDNHEEFDEAIESAAAALEPRALITGNTAKAMQSRAVLKVALRHYARNQPRATLPGFIAMLGDLPSGVSELPKGPKLAAELSANLHAAMVNDPLFGGHGASADPGVLLTPSPGRRARVSVINMAGLTNDQQREGFVNQLQMALFSWIKRHPAGNRPLGGLLVMDEAQNFAPSDRYTACTRSTLALVSQARKYGLGLVFATQAPRGLHNYVPGNAATQFYGLLNSPAQIATAREMARVKGGEVPDISKLRAGNFYVALEGEAFHRIRAPWCLSHHPQSPPTTDEVLQLARAGGR